MKMKLAVRRRYLRFLLPAFALLLLLALLLLWISGFGFRYLLRRPAQLSEVPTDQLKGSYVTMPVTEAGEQFTYLGYQDSAGNPVITEEYTVAKLRGKYLMIRVTKKDLPVLDKYLHASELVQSGELGSVLEANMGKLTGTVNKARPDAEKQLRSWFISHQLDARNKLDKLSGADISSYPGVAEGKFDGYLDDVILPLELDVGYLGTRSGGAVKALTVIAVLLVLLALALAVSVFLGFWEKRMRAALRQHGKRLAADFDTAEIFGARLRIGQDFLWVFGPLTTRILETKDILWAYPRSKRLEGGKQAWSLVMKTEWGSEASAKLDSEAAVEKAVAALQSRGFPLTVGFDKEKQKLYKKDLAAFKSKVRSGSI
jgi:hypothetical protein